MKKPILIPLLMLIVVGCHQLPGESVRQNSQYNRCQMSHAKTTDRSQMSLSELQARYNEVKIQMYSYQLGDEAVVRPNWLQPQNLLPALNPWFESGITFCQERTDDVNYLRVARIPKAVLATINTTFDPSGNGLGILNSKFWFDVRKIQDAGIEVGFVIHKPNQQFGGMFIPDRKLILFNTLADPGTPRHEFRHYLQYRAVQNVKSEAIRQNSVMSAECLEQSIRYFDELDANTYQMKDWVGTFQVPEQLIKSEGSHVLLFPEIELFGGYLHYPGLAASWLTSANCDPSYMQTIGNIVTYTHAFSSQMGGMAESYWRQLMWYAVESRREDGQCNSIGGGACAPNKIKFQLQQFNHQINQILIRESQQRPAYIRNVLLQLPQPTRNVLSETSGGFKFLIEGY